MNPLKFLGTAFILLNSILTFGQSGQELHLKISSSLKKMNSVTYKSTQFISTPWDTVLFKSTESIVTLFPGRSRPSFAIAPYDSPWNYEYCYDGKFIVKLNWNKKNAKIDTLSGHSEPAYTFFERIQKLIEYSTSNPVGLELNTFIYQDSTVISYLFKNQLIQFSPKKADPKKESENNSEFIMTVNNSTGLPFKLYSKLPHQHRLEICSDVEQVEIYQEDFESLNQIPADFSLNNKQKSSKFNTSELVGSQAPSWSLIDNDGEIISSNQYENKILIIQFTGIGCGPCHQSIPFLNQISSNAKGRIEVVALETWDKNQSKVSRYIEKNSLQYKLLVSTDEINNQFRIFNGVPTFFVVDENSIIKGVFAGYSTGSTDKEIEALIEKLL